MIICVISEGLNSQMEPPIPLKGVVLFIAFGTMVFIIVFCFVKRQITRFTLRSSSGPHALIGSDAPKPLSAEIERRLKWVKDIVYEPPLLQPGMEEKLRVQSHSDPRHFLYRMKAIDAVPLLDAEMKKFNPSISRKPGTPLKTFLLEQRQIGALEGAKLELVEKFCNAYEHARHEPKNFSLRDYQQFMDLLMQVINHIRNRVNSSEAAASETVMTESHEKTAKSEAGSRILTRNLQYRILPDNSGSPDNASENPDRTTSQGVETSRSQRIANYALAGELSMKADATKTKQV